jgi:hypothetical protein
MAGGVYMERPKPAEHFFGASEDGKVLPHVGKAPSAIDCMLMSQGLGRLEDGAGLISQLAFLVQDHEHLRSLVVRCEPENRSAMYELRPSPLRGGGTHLQAHPTAGRTVHRGSGWQAGRVQTAES